MYTKYIKIKMSWIPPLKTHDKASKLVVEETATAGSPLSPLVAHILT